MNAATPALPRSARWALAIAAGIAMRFGYGLEPLWWLALLAPVPLLVAAQHASAREAAALALVAALIGPVLPWSYLAGLMPLPVVVGIAAAMALQWAAVIVVTRALHQRGPGWCTPFGFGITLAAFDALLAAASPDGTAASLAYTQADALPLVQVASLGGTPAITFVMGLVAALLAAAADPGSRLRFSRAALGATVLLLAATITFGVWRLALPAGGATLPVAAVAIDARIADRRSDPAAFERLLADYEAAVSRAVASQPRLVLLPERIGDIASTDVDAVAQRLAAAARNAKADLVVGFGERIVQIDVHAYDWNCPKYITPRYSEGEVAQRIREATSALAAQALQRNARPGEPVGDGELALTVTGVRQMTPRIRAYELRANVTAHDASYVALAEGLAVFSIRVHGLEAVALALGPESQKPPGGQESRLAVAPEPGGEPLGTAVGEGQAEEAVLAHEHHVLPVGGEARARLVQATGAGEGRAGGPVKGGIEVEQDEEVVAQAVVLGEGELRHERCSGGSRRTGNTSPTASRSMSTQRIRGSRRNHRS